MICCFRKKNNVLIPRHLSQKCKKLLFVTIAVIHLIDTDTPPLISVGYLLFYGVECRDCAYEMIIVTVCALWQLRSIPECFVESKKGSTNFRKICRPPEGLVEYQKFLSNCRNVTQTAYTNGLLFFLMYATDLISTMISDILGAEWFKRWRMRDAPNHIKVCRVPERLAKSDKNWSKPRKFAKSQKYSLNPIEVSWITESLTNPIRVCRITKNVRLITERLPEF